MSAPAVVAENLRNERMRISKQTGLLNLVEPHYLVQTFLNNPPYAFKPVSLSCGADSFPAFLADFSLITTMEGKAKKILASVPFLDRLLRFPSLFIGTTATEYANYPDLRDYKELIATCLQEIRKTRASLLIVKDLPDKSPFLSETENLKSELLLKQCQEAGFMIVEGQALAYVPLDVSSVDEYMKRLSKSRRKEFRKKLKESSHVEVEVLNCGASEFFDEAFLDLLYRMYLEVFAQSEIHFDKLTKNYFRELLQSPACGGRVFCYKADGRLIGYNICFVENNCLVDKYVGFVYPEARRNNLYFLSWFYNIDYAIKHGLSFYIAGWTDPAVKAALGARFTMTRHAVYIANPLLRSILTPLKHLFESDSIWMEKSTNT